MGLILEDALNSKNIIMINNGQPTHIMVASGQLSAIDLTFFSSDLGEKGNWAVADNHHFPIGTETDLPTSPLPAIFST